MSTNARTVSASAALALRMVFLSIVAVIMFAPFLVMIGTSLESMKEVYSASYVFVPSKLLFVNFVHAMQRGTWGRYFFNSTFVTSTSILLSLVSNSMAGYAFAKLKFAGQNVLFIIVLIGLMIPAQVTIVPLFIMLKHVPLFGGNDILGNGGTGWINTYWGLILPNIAGSFGVFLCRQFYLNFPSSLNESAMLDGATKFQIYRKIYVPLSGPVLATLAILKATYTWNDYIWPLVLTSTPEMATVQLALSKFRTEFQIEWNNMMASTIVIVLPMIVLFLFLQRYFVEGALTSGMKG